MFGSATRERILRSRCLYSSLRASGRSPVSRTVFCQGVRHSGSTFRVTHLAHGVRPPPNARFLQTYQGGHPASGPGILWNIIVNVTSCHPCPIPLGEGFTMGGGGHGGPFRVCPSQEGWGSTQL